ncbi:DNA-binding protein [Tenacibaculum holothuriorum]|uniref:DNA-binding protein n=1 Tax=Tenacibaculum holothuriorum TaxID=1635173 RepID=A0A1Y2PD58_9FLAO|nr:DNA-binding protein [Tenacibaculum holothuriorum]OSY88413.1 DNA-binding protein [Tenacibaculum holothuriorum]
MELKEGDKVDLIIGVQTALGYTVLINESYEGLLYNNEVFKDLEEGIRTVGYIKKIREDEKIDVSLRPQGFRNVIDEDVDKVLSKLKEKGYLLLTDKSSPESIKFHLQMSKKAFKKAVGNLYKSKRIELEKDRIVLKK